MWLLDFGRITTSKEVLAYMLAAATMEIALRWKIGADWLLREWEDRVRQMGLISKLSAIIRNRAGKEKAISEFMVHWECFANSKYNFVTTNARDCILVIL